jgi:hypothetical protein
VSGREVGLMRAEGGRGQYSQPGYPSRQRNRRRARAARVAAPLAVPMALGLTLGIILAVSAQPSVTHITQTTGAASSSSTSPSPSPSAHPTPSVKKTAQPSQLLAADVPSGAVAESDVRLAGATNVLPDGPAETASWVALPARY